MSSEAGAQSDAPAFIPECVQTLVRGYSWVRNTIGKAGGAVYRLDHPAASSLYLKYGLGAGASEIIEETVRMRWLAGRVPVPEIRHFSTTEDGAWLLMTALPGQTAYELLEKNAGDRIAIVDALAEFLRRLHSHRIEECPFNSGHEQRLAEAQWRLAAGQVDISSFDDAHAGFTGAQVWDQMMSYLPMTFDSVLTHGDFSLENILMGRDRISGVIDVARAGIADRYQDLAILWNCLGDFGAPLQERLLVSYGISRPDERKLHFHLSLDEFF